MKRLLIISFFLCIILLPGCNKAPEEETADQNGISFTSMEEEPVLSYEVPVSTPGILINQLGYTAGSTKTAVLKGDEIPELFHIVDAETGKIVFTGFPEEKGYDGEFDEYIGYGDFSEFQTPGIYYIEAPVLGRSYQFTIDDSVYDGIFHAACKQYYYNRCGMTLTEEYAGEKAHNACHTGKAVLREDASVSVDVSGGWHQDERGQKDVAAAAKAMSVMLLSYELYGNAFGDDTGIPESGNGVPDLLDEIKYEVEWMLKMQNQETGAVYAGITVYVQNGNNPVKTSGSYVEPATPEAERAFAMALAKFSYLYQNYDTEYATNCLKAADRAWKHAQLHDDGEIDKWEFAAAAELYRAAGQSSYHKYIADYLRDSDYQSQMDEIVLLGCVTYIATKQPVTVELCEDIMKMLMMYAEDIAENARKSPFFTSGNIEQDNNNDMLLEMMYLTVVNHIISNHEYETIIENYLHYFLGRNSKAVSYIDNAGENNYESIDSSLGIMKQFDADSKLLFMLSDIISKVS